MIFAREERFTLKHFGEDASRTPYVYLNIVLLPSKHDFRRPVVPRRDISSHLRVLNTGQAEVADLQIAVFVDENVAGLEIAVDNTSRVNVLQPSLIDVSNINKATAVQKRGSVPGSDTGNIG